MTTIALSLLLLGLIFFITPSSAYASFTDEEIEITPAPAPTTSISKNPPMLI
jgi:hypothetical protein